MSDQTTVPKALYVPLILLATIPANLWSPDYSCGQVLKSAKAPRPSSVNARVVNTNDTNDLTRFWARPEILIRAKQIVLVEIYRQLKANLPGLWPYPRTARQQAESKPVPDKIYRKAGALLLELENVARKKTDPRGHTARLEPDSSFTLPGSRYLPAGINSVRKTAPIATSHIR
jgi:hypothetical protein